MTQKRLAHLDRMEYDYAPKVRSVSSVGMIITATLGNETLSANIPLDSLFYDTDDRRNGTTYVVDTSKADWGPADRMQDETF